MIIGMDSFYLVVKQQDPQTYENIVAFASTFGAGDEDISVNTRYKVERFCMELAARKAQP